MALRETAFRTRTIERHDGSISVLGGVLGTNLRQLAQQHNPVTMLEADRLTRFGHFPFALGLAHDPDAD